jgi:hypothetical protein
LPQRVSASILGRGKHFGEIVMAGFANRRIGAIVGALTSVLLVRAANMKLGP